MSCVTPRATVAVVGPDGDVTFVWLIMSVYAPPPFTLYLIRNRLVPPALIVPSSVQSTFRFMAPICPPQTKKLCHTQVFTTEPTPMTVEVVALCPVFVFPVTAEPPCDGSGVVFDVALRV